MLNDDCKRWVQEHLHEQPAALLLKYQGRALPFDLREAVTQVECRRRCGSKLRSFLSHDDFRFADTLSSEQASHEAVGRFHASLVKPGARVLDMTAGLGIDAMSMAIAGARVTAVELDTERAEALRDNARTMQAPVEVHHGDGVALLLSQSEGFDVIFIDPARRDDVGRRTYGLADCTPDVLALMPELLSRCRRLLIKASPLLDIAQVLREVTDCTRLWAVSVQGECKELLIEVAPCGTWHGVTAVDIDTSGEAATFSIPPGETSPPAILASASEVCESMYLYEPSASIMKCAPWGEITRRYPELRKLDASSHLFVSEVLYSDFPGRIMRIKERLDKQGLKRLKGSEINVATRNYPLSPEALAAKYGLRSSPLGQLFLFGSRAAGRPLLMLTRRVEFPD